MKKAIVLSVAALALTAACGSSDRDANERILRSLPELPGSERLLVVSQPYNDCRDAMSSRTLGHTTRAEFRAPPGMTTNEVVDFYVEHLKDDWQYQVEPIGMATPGERVPVPVQPGRPRELGTPVPTVAAAGQVLGSIPAVRFERGTATISVNTGNMALRGLAGVSPTEHLQAPPPGYDFTVYVDAEGTVDRPYCD